MVVPPPCRPSLRCAFPEAVRLLCRKLPAHYRGDGTFPSADGHQIRFGMNREAFELDAGMYSDDLPEFARARTARVSADLDSMAARVAPLMPARQSEPALRDGERGLQTAFQRVGLCPRLGSSRKASRLTM